MMRLRGEINHKKIKKRREKIMKRRREKKRTLIINLLGSPP